MLRAGAVESLRRVLLGVPGLLVSSAAVTTADFVLGAQGASSAVLTALAILLAIAWGDVLRGSRSGERRLRTTIVQAVLGTLMGLSLLAKTFALSLSFSDAARYGPSYRTYTFAAFLVFVVGLLGRGDRLSRFLAESADHPARLTLLSFGTGGVIGGFLLALPPSLQRVSDASLLDAMFMAFSALCVTGLAVHNVAETYTFFGQLVLLSLIQIGGLGIMVISASFTVLAGRRFQVKSGAVLAEMIDAESIASLRRMIFNIVVYSLAIEAVGAAVIYLEVQGQPDVALAVTAESAMSGAGSHVWAAIFHSVSAFCNAGFTLFRGG